MDDKVILDQLYSKEKLLIMQLNATRQAIVGFGGRVKELKPVAELVEEKTQVIKEEPPKPEAKRETVKVDLPIRNNREEVYGYMEEIFKEVGVPINNQMMQSKLAQLGIQYTIPVIAKYMSNIVKDGRALRISRGLYAHLDYKHPENLKKNIVSIVEVEQYAKLRGEVTRQELLDVFVKGGRMTESMVQLRIDKFIREKRMTRKEPGVYKWNKRK